MASLFPSVVLLFQVMLFGSAAIVSGWRIEVSDKLQTWCDLTDRTGRTLCLENADRLISIASWEYLVTPIRYLTQL
jgi:hypothetical protein